jgi:hypothetical protein
MNQDLLQEVPGTAPAEASPTESARTRETAFAEHLRLLDNAVSLTRSRAELQEKELLSLQAQVGRIREKFETLKTRTEDAELCLPLPKVEIPERNQMFPPLKVAGRAEHLRRLLPYAVLAVVALMLAPRARTTDAKLHAGAAKAPAPIRVDSGRTEAVALVRAFIPEGARKSFGEAVTGAGSWEVDKVGDAVYLVSFHPLGAAAPESSYDFTVDLGEKSVTPEMDTTARLLAGR